MVREILKMGDPRLLLKAQPVVDIHESALHELVEDMFETMHEADGIGLAAPQIGVSLQVMVFGMMDEDEIKDRYQDVPKTVLINPQIDVLTDECDEMWEGCLSVPKMRGIVKRPIKIRYQGVDLFGKKIDRIAEHFHARVVLHEYDHLIGKLYPMRIDDLSDFGFIDSLPKQSA